MQPHSPQQIERILLDMDLDVIEANKSVVRFWFNGNIIQFFPKRQWATGKGIDDGRGWDRLLKQLKQE